MDKVSLGQKIRIEREKLHLTQENLAEDLDVTASYIGQIERGKKGITLDNLIALAKRFGITIDFLLSGSVPMQEDSMYHIWSQLMADKTEKEKLLAIELVRTLFKHLKEDSAPDARR